VRNGVGTTSWEVGGGRVTRKWKKPIDLARGPEPRATECYEGKRINQKDEDHGTGLS
jgi:hypothetical protein